MNDDNIFDISNLRVPPGLVGRSRWVSSAC